MERREMLKTVGAAMAAAVASSALAADHNHDHSHHHNHPSNPYAALIASSSDCLKTGEACLAHCLILLGEGDKEMASCAQSVNGLLAVCSTLGRLAGQNSKHTKAMAKVAADVCAECEKECRKHEKKHEECKACAEACASCLKECKKLSA
ncbi:four-helix bundle copper-binding protein [Dechloromonas sp. HYN0024]|uniref:four-helix bundle copper-binding protein n=1 Tax=Dechloromonas sp. HYN0024 TaxID=2231055 RepID=UPI000E44D0EF|nr:four-helix bundle copper-binding protein [Dechloromonas sp. HYN0024]AXS81252.1 four-helix bundle copper-binding protein [Dechloromonas sp. HYN0024]